MSNEEIAIRIQGGERELLSQLWEQNTGIFNLNANRLYSLYRNRCISSGVTIDDIVQICFFALLEAVRAFNPHSGYKMLTYLRYPLLKQFRMIVGLHTSKRNPLNDCYSLNTKVGDGEGMERLELEIDTDSESQFEAATDKVYALGLRHALESALSKLPSDCAASVRGLYLEDKSNNDIAAQLGKRPQRVVYLQTKAMRRLQRNAELQAYSYDILSKRVYRSAGIRCLGVAGLPALNGQ